MKPACVYCGNNPVPHFLYWQNESLNILFTGLRQKLLFNPLTRGLAHGNFGPKLALFFLSLAESLRIVTRRKDGAKFKVRRAEVMWEEAQRRGIDMQELLLFGRPFDTYIAEKSLEARGKGQVNRIVFSGLPRPASYRNPLLDLIDDKGFFKQIFQNNHLSTPAGGSASSFREAVKIFRSINKPAIVKPRAGSRGRHSTTFIYTEEDLKKAFKIAKSLCHWVIVEEQIFGPVYRATVVNFELVGVLRGDTPQVTGDGASSILELVKIKNQLPHPGVKDVITDERLEIFLSRQNLELSSIPQKDEIINLSEKVGVPYGGSSAEEFEICHPQNKELFVKAAKVLGDPLLGFDFIIGDITKPWKEQKCGFIEVNSMPFINLHYDPLHGRPRNVAAKVWDMLNW